MHIHPGERLSGPATPLPTSGGRFPFSILRKVHKVNSGLNNPVSSVSILLNLIHWQMGVISFLPKKKDSM